MKKSITLLIIVIVVSCLSVLRRHRSESVESSEMEVSVPYLRAVSSLAKKDSLERIVASGGGELVSSEWEEFRFDLKRIPRISSWQAKARGRLVVVGESEDFRGRISIIQDLTGDRDGLIASSRMDGESGFLKAYSSELRIMRGERTKVGVSSRIVYERIVPFWMRDEVDALVIEHNKSRLESMMSEIVSLIED